jgi:hypothetical protein
MPEVRQSNQDRKRKREYDFRIWLFEYLSRHPCVDCGQKNPIVLEFDHVVEDEHNRCVTSMAQASVKRLLEEIAKCEVVCANCHTLRTAKRANSLRWQMFTAAAGR